uniref:Uncharacterized protein n=1 Tax=Salvator merianae TaxID=96440 RepID=A0A8D0BLK8_SALMN
MAVLDKINNKDRWSPGAGGFLILCSECHIYDNPPTGQKSWMLVLREWVSFLVAEVAEQEKQRDSERMGESNVFLKSLFICQDLSLFSPYSLDANSF